MLVTVARIRNDVWDVWLGRDTARGSDSATSPWSQAGLAGTGKAAFVVQRLERVYKHLSREKINMALTAGLDAGGAACSLGTDIDEGVSAYLYRFGAGPHNTACVHGCARLIARFRDARSYPSFERWMEIDGHHQGLSLHNMIETKTFVARGLIPEDLRVMVAGDRRGSTGMDGCEDEMFQLFGEAKDQKNKKETARETLAPNIAIIRAVAARVPDDGRKGRVGESGVTRAVEAVCGVCASPCPCWPHAGFRLLLQIISLLSLHQQQRDGGGGRKQMVVSGLFGCVRACPLLLPRVL